MRNIEQSISTAQTISDAASKTTYTGAGMGILGMLSNIDWVTIIGVGVAVIGLFVNIFFKIREDRRAQELHEFRKENIKKGKCYDDK